MVSGAPPGPNSTSYFVTSRSPADFLQAERRRTRKTGSIPTPSEKSQLLVDHGQGELSESFNEQLNHKISKMDRLADKLDLIAAMMSFQPGQHTEAWNDNVVEFLKETKGCAALVQKQKEEAHYNMVLGLVVAFVALGGLLLLGGYYFVRELLY
ncbi:hypothetical protein B0T21DRAFT_352669 [Apiosordaria backusii]|uniref:Uncharacterized protein n=1 Tax=Apiosordaria backusii TaxID=314023 RepID=A0AA40A722_9PEZI|nr:hypothetical protein B0T21DRAFT_352669 [Apiosordaria backusii]